MSCTIPSCQSLDSHITGNPTSFVVISGKLDLFPFRLRGRGWGWVGLCALCFCFLLFSYSMHQMQIMWQTCQPSQVYSSFAKARLVRPRVFFRLLVLAIESIDMVCFELLRAWAPPRRRFYSSWNYLYFPEIFSQRKLRIHVMWHGNRKHFTVKMQVCSLHLRKKIGLMKVFEWKNFGKR